MNNTELVQYTDQEIRIAPESLEVAQIYIQTLDLNAAATELNLPLEEVVYHLEKREVKKFVDAVFFDKGYMNRHKLQSAVDHLIDLKFEELEEAEMGSSKDIADLLKLASDLREKELKAMQVDDKLNPPLVQQNNQINLYGENYKNLLNSIIEGKTVA